MKTTTRFLMPPWDMETAAKRLAVEEAAWNTQDPEMVLTGYADEIEMRDGTTFINSKEMFRHFLLKKFQQQKDYTVKLDLWGALKGRMAVRYEATWQTASGEPYKSYGVQVFQFNEHGLVEKRFASEEAASAGATQTLL
jgi:nuclear transport factor 2 (NTF2) superfamily protein